MWLILHVLPLCTKFDSTIDRPNYCTFGNRFALRMTSVSVMLAGEQPTALLNST